MKIICLIGPSGSGKSTVGQILRNKGIPEIISHTTRTPRVNEINGDSYYFVSTEVFDQLEFIESVNYAGNKYGTSVKEVNEKSKISNILFTIVTYDGYESFVRKFGKESVFSIYLETDINKCVDRMKNRGDSDKNIIKRIANYKSMDEFETFRKCDFILNNSSDLNSLKRNIDNMLGFIKN